MEKSAEAREIVREYKDIREDYVFNPDTFSEEPDKVARLKWIIENKLSDADRIIILLYVDCHSYRKLGRRLHLSHTTVAAQVRRIKAAILQEYEKIKDNERLF